MCSTSEAAGEGSGFITSSPITSSPALDVLPFAPDLTTLFVMEINQLRRSLDDLTERNEALRRFL
jgi:hypothetical protein